MGELEVHNGERWGKVVLKSWAFQTIDRRHRNIHLHDRRKSDKLITFVISLLTGNICTAVFWLYGQKLFRCLIRCCLSPCVDLQHNIQFIMRLLQICILKEFPVLQWNLYIYDTLLPPIVIFWAQSLCSWCIIYIQYISDWLNLFIGGGITKH